MERLEQKEEKSAAGEVINLAVEAARAEASGFRSFGLQVIELNVIEVARLPAFELRANLVDGVPAAIENEAVDVAEALQADDFRRSGRVIRRHFHRTPFAGGIFAIQAGDYAELRIGVHFANEAFEIIGGQFEVAIHFHDVVVRNVADRLIAGREG